MNGRRLLVGLLVLGFALHGLTAPAAGARLTTAGWWWRAQTGALSFPPPPHVPPEGLAVGNSADGPTAVSALRFALEAEETDPMLSLVVAETFAAADVALVACPSAAPWFGTQAGTWDDRPEAGCAGGTVNGVQADDGASWTFPLAPLYGDGLLDVVILPAEGSAPFEISFEPPTAESLRTTRASTPPEFDAGFEPAAGDSGGTFALPPSGFEGGEFSRPSLGPLPSQTDGSGTAAPATPADDDRQRFVAIARPGPAGGEEGDPRALALVILLAALAASLTLGREPLPAPRLLGPMAGRQRQPAEDEAEIRGLGRFRRPRPGPPPSLH